MKQTVKWDLRGLNEITGEKIILRFPKISDANIITKEVNKPEVLNNIILRDKKYSLKNEQDWIKSMAVKRRRNLEIHWVIEEKGTKNFVGVCGFNHRTESQYKRGCIGMWLIKEYWGKGYSREVAKILFRIGFTNLRLNKITSEVYSFNIRSRKHVERVGFVLEGIQKDNVTFHNKKIDDYLFGITKSMWEKMNRK